MLTLLLIIPIIGSLIMIPIQDSISNQSLLKKIALITTLTNLVLSILVWIQFDPNTTQYQFVSEFNQLSFCHLNIEIDVISILYY